MRERLNFNRDWLFHEGDIFVEAPRSKGLIYAQAKTERHLIGPASVAYPDGVDSYGGSRATAETWEKVALPHDYVIAQTPNEKNNNTLGYFEYNNAWYRKHFTLDAACEGKRVVLFFEGVAVHCTVYVNGCRMQDNTCGYTSFEVDITDVARFGQENVVAVYVNTQEHEGWWYEGAGIYRDVWLEITESVAIERDGVFVHPELTGGESWNVPVDTELRNDDYEDAAVSVETVLYTMAGQEIARAKGEMTVPARDHGTLRQAMTVENPALWDTESPVLHLCETTVVKDGEIVDRTTCRFGFRTIRFDPDHGFFLNGRHVVIKGVCCHQDYGLTGKAVPRRVQKYRLELLREMGANGYRTAHYPHHAATMDYLDELGFLVMDETRWFETTPDGIRQLEMLVKRDRNRPGVIFWSLGNEEPMHIRPEGRRIARALKTIVRRLDPTRPVTTAQSVDPLHSTVLADMDVIGVNYNIEHYDELHRMYPDKPFFSSECCATGTTRGWYLDDCPARGYINGYDRRSNSWFRGREETWQWFMAREWVCGGYQWAGIEHRGETMWPRLCSQSGAIDLYLNRKDAFWQNQSHWTEKPMVHILPHWNLSGREGEPVRVSVYTNCDSVELFQDGRSMGVQAVEPFGHVEWRLIYNPGSVRAVGYKDGEPAAEETVETTGRAVALRLKLERDNVRADGQDVAIITCDCVDSEGRHVPDAAPFVRFNTNGLGYVAGTGSDVSDHTPVTCPDRQMRAGLISVLVRAGEQAGMLRVYAEAEGLKPARLDVQLL